MRKIPQDVSKKRTYNVSEIQVGDIVKFKGTRNKGIRKILKINPSKLKYTWNIEDYYETSYFSQVLNQKMSGFSEEPYTSTNSVDKLSHVFRDGTWYKVVKD